MFYLLYLHYADVARDYPLLNLIQYQTVRTGLALLTAIRTVLVHYIILHDIMYR